MNENIKIYFYFTLLFILFILGLSKVYEKGFIDGASKLCDKTLGYNEFNELVCYEEEINDNQDIYNYGIEVKIDGT